MIWKMDPPSRTVSEQTDTAKFNEIYKVVKENVFGCDLLLCLFMSALCSYRVDRCLRPYPNMYVNDGIKNVDLLRSVSASIPSLVDILNGTKVCTREVIQLLHWLFIQNDQPILKRTHIDQIPLPESINLSLKPNFVFEVIYPSKIEQIWWNRKGERRTFTAYHGSQLDNFYSILRFGLQQNFSTAKELLFGKGIYLTTELLLAITYAPFGLSWNSGLLGNKHSIVAICEVIDDIEKVKYKDSNCRERSRIQGSVSGEIPEKYFVVTDSDMVRIKYLFVYKEKLTNLSNLRSYWLLITFILLLVVIFLFRSVFKQPVWIKFWKKLYRSINSEEL